MNDKLIIVGVAGTAGSGKDTVSDMLSKLFGMRNLSSSDAVRAITRHVYHLPPDYNPVRDQLYVVANFLRAEVNPATTVLLCILQAQAQNLQRVVISGLRSMGEAEAIRNAGGIIIGVDANPRIRYDRISARARDAENLKTYEEFIEQDNYENRGLSDQGPARGIRSIIDSADIVFTNDTTTLEELQQELQTRVAPLLH